MKNVLAFCIVFGMVLGSHLVYAAGHSGGEVRCLDCHVSLPFENRPIRLHAGISALCLGCHGRFPCNPEGKESYFSHPLDVVPDFEIPADMPLDSEKKIGCMTCHIFHYEKKESADLQPSLLRRTPGIKLCFSCHGKR